MFTYSDGTIQGQRERALVLGFFALDSEGASMEDLALHEASNIPDEDFDDLATELLNEGLLARDAFGEYGITAKGEAAYDAARSIIVSMESEINRQAFGEQIAA